MMLYLLHFNVEGFGLSVLVGRPFLRTCGRLAPFEACVSRVFNADVASELLPTLGSDDVVFNFDKWDMRDMVA